MISELVLTTTLCLVSWVFYKWATANNRYFERRNVKYMKPTFFIGNSADILSPKYTAIEYAKKIYESFPDEAIYGLFNFRAPQIVVRSPETIKQLCVKDFDYFEDHAAFTDDKTDKLWGNSLFVMKGEKWRQMRATLSPAFTGSKMRQMFVLVSECADDIVQHFSKQAANGNRINLEMKDFFSRYTNDVIATCAFGLKINSIAEPENEFYINGKNMADLNNLKSIAKILIFFTMPALARTFELQLLDPYCAKSFKNLILETMEVRKNQKIFRPDMINMLMQVREGGLKHQNDEKTSEKEGFATVEESEVGKDKVNRKWNDDEIVAQCFLFFLAGFDTSSTMLTFASFELVANPNIQQRLYEEIADMNEQLGGKRVTYDALQKMKYMDQFVCESLRKWPPAIQTDRVCIKNYTFDNGNGQKFNIEKGISLALPIYGIHHDPNYFPEPGRFDPERFNDENKSNIQPGTYIPFGVGPRNCIGSRFALMQIKAILYNMLLNFSFEANEKTEIPLKLKKSTFSLNPENGMFLELKPRQK